MVGPLPLNPSWISSLKPLEPPPTWKGRKHSSTCNTPVLAPFALKGIWCNIVINHIVELKAKAPPWISVLCFGDWKWCRWYFVLAMHVKMLDIMCVCKIKQKPTTSYVGAMVMKRAWFPKDKEGELLNFEPMGKSHVSVINPLLTYSPFLVSSVSYHIKTFCC